MIKPWPASYLCSFAEVFDEKVMQVSIWPVTIPPPADPRATNFFLQNPRPGDSFSV